jgi:hypothetical protein
VPPTHALARFYNGPSFLVINRSVVNSTLLAVLDDGNGIASSYAIDYLLARDDSVAPYGGFGYSFEGQPTLFGSTIQLFLYNNFSQVIASATCYYARVQFFFYYARNAPAFDDGYNGKPCYRYGINFDESWTYDQSPSHVFLRSLRHDGFGVRTTNYNQSLSGSPCVSSLTINFQDAETPLGNYSDSSSATVVSGPNSSAVITLS